MPTPRVGTWLVSSDGLLRWQVSGERLTATWAPDSHRIAFTFEKGPTERRQDDEVYTQDVVAREPQQLLARLPNPVWYPTWSPGCEDSADRQVRDCGADIAVMTSDSGDVYGVSLIDANSGRIRKAGQFAPRVVELTPSMLKWSPLGDLVELESEDGTVGLRVQGTTLVPIVAICKSPCGAPFPDGKLRAWPEYLDGHPGGPARLAVARADTGGRVTFETVFDQVEGVHWTQDGRRVLVNSYTGPGYALWAIDPAVGQTELVAKNVYFLGTTRELLQRSTELGAPRVTLRSLPTDEIRSTWVVRELPALGLRLRIPPQWRLDVQENGDAVLADFDSEEPIGSAPMRSDTIELAFRRCPGFWTAARFSGLAVGDYANGTSAVSRRADHSWRAAGGRPIPSSQPDERMDSCAGAGWGDLDHSAHARAQDGRCRSGHIGIARVFGPPAVRLKPGQPNWELLGARANVPVTEAVS